MSNHNHDALEQEIIRLDAAVDEFAAEMKERLFEEAKQGYRGWDSEYPTKNLAIEAHKGVHEILMHTDCPPKKECVDTANRLMFLWRRGG